MGLEARCIARWGVKVSRGTAVLEPDEVLFRGEFRVRVPLAEVTSCRVDRGHLVLRWGDQTLALEIGKAAERWQERIVHPKSRAEKIGIRPRARVAIVGIEDAGFVAEVRAAGAEVVAAGDRDPVDLLFLGVDRKEDLAAVERLRSRLRPDGALWTVRPKGSALVAERDVLGAGRAAGLVDTKVVRFSATHTAEKFVVPVARR